jgi:hypothetical protein
MLPVLARNTRLEQRRSFTRKGEPIHPPEIRRMADAVCRACWEVRMAGYSLIESRDPFDSKDVRFCCDLAQQLAAAKHEVRLFLVQNGVLPARPGAHSGDSGASGDA